MREVVIRIQVPDGVNVDVDYAEVPPEPPHMAEMPPVAAAPSETVPSCPQHGAMTYHPAKTKPDGQHVNARYSCDVKVNDAFCPTKAVWLGKRAA